MNQSTRALPFFACLIVMALGQMAHGQSAFTRITDSAGISIPSNGNEHGVSWVDYNLDGHLDLLITDTDWAWDRLYSNNGSGGFISGYYEFPTDATLDAHNVAWGDYDNDGFPDRLANPAWGSSPNEYMLFRYNGTSFDDVTSIAEIENYWGPGATWVDYDRDGHLDFSGVQLLHNDGDGTFSPGPLAEVQFTHTWGDYDADGDQDKLYHNGRLLRNDNGTFIDVTALVGLDEVVSADAAVWGDYNNDGYIDIFFARNGTDLLYKNHNGSTFVDYTFTAGVGGDGHNAFSAAWADYDNDGYLDLAVSNEGNPSPDLSTPDYLYNNNGDGTFSDVSALSGFLDSNSKGIAWGDFDNDGDLDLYIAGRSTLQSEGNLYRNNLESTPNPGNWLQMELVGATSNRSAIGARVVVMSSAGVMSRQVRAGHGQFSQNSTLVEFGLGSSTSYNFVAIVWPNGNSEFVYPTLNERVTIDECTGPATITSFNGWAGEGNWPNQMELNFDFTTSSIAYGFEVRFREQGTSTWSTVQCSSPGTNCDFDDDSNSYSAQAIYPACEMVRFEWQVRIKDCSNPFGYSSWSTTQRFKSYCVEGPPMSPKGTSEGPQIFAASSRSLRGGGASVVVETPGAGSLKVSVYDLRGRRVTTLIDAIVGAGTRELTWNAPSVSDGVYFYRAVFQGEERSGKILRIGG